MGIERKFQSGNDFLFCSIPFLLCVKTFSYIPKYHYNPNMVAASVNTGVYCVKSPFTLIVIPGLTRNPVFPNWIPAGVYPDGNRGGNDSSQIIVKPLLRHYASNLSAQRIYQRCME
jgi:hypothetical protein